VGVRAVDGLLGGALTACLAVAGCGHSDGLPNADDPVVWADRVCASLQPLAALKDESPHFDANNPAATRDSMARYFSDAADRSGQSLKGLSLAGPSPIAGGDDVASRLRAALQRRQAAYANARDKVERINPNDPVGIGTQLPGVLRDLANASDDTGLDSLGNNPELNDAVKRAPGCRLVGSANRAATQDADPVTGAAPAAPPPAPGSGTMPGPVTGDGSSTSGSGW
jgi:hypothetical protein